MRPDDAGIVNDVAHGMAFGQFGAGLRCCRRVEQIDLYRLQPGIGKVGRAPRHGDDFIAGIEHLAAYFGAYARAAAGDYRGMTLRSEEHTSELQSLMRISYAVFCLIKT